ncbi:hypothetical protein Tco_0559272 [Tanacetum coccineum]
MSNLKFAKTHNLVAFLEKPEESDGFEGIIYFLKASSIRYALTVNPTIYTSCIKRFWATAKVNTVNGEVQIQALVVGKKVIVTKISVRRALQLKDAEGTECLPNATIFAELERMGSKTTTWNEFSSTMAFAIICLALNQKFNFSMYIFDNMVKTLEGGVKFLMYLRKVFANMKSEGKGFSRRVIPLFETMMVQAPEELEIAKLKEKLKKLERRSKSRTPGLKRLRKGRKIADLDADAEVTLVDEAQGRIDDNLMFDTGVFDEHEVKVEKIKAAKPKAVTTAATTTTTAVTRPKARGVAKDKGKAKMIEPGKPLKKKDQILVDEEIAQRLQEELQAELEEEERLARQKEEEDNLIS